MSGLIADSRTMVDRARVDAQNHWFVYNEPMSVESVTQSVSNLAMMFGEEDEEKVMVGGRGLRIQFGLRVLGVALAECGLGEWVWLVEDVNECNEWVFV